MKLKGKLDVPNIYHTEDALQQAKRVPLGLRLYDSGTKVRLTRGESILFQGSRSAFRDWLTALKGR